MKTEIKCSTCIKKFAAKSGLNKHVKVVHEEIKEFFTPAKLLNKNVGLDRTVHKF